MSYSEAVTVAELADFLGLSTRTVKDLAARGVLPRTGRGRYDLKASVRNYARSLRDSAALRGGDDATTAARRREVEARAEKVELQNAKTRRELVPAVEVERRWTAILTDVRARMLAIPSRVRARLGHLTAADEAVVAAEVRDALEGAADASTD